MPIVQVSISPQGKEKKAEMSKAVTDELSRITNIPKEKFVVLINELPKESIAVGGELLSELHKS